MNDLTLGHRKSSSLSLLGEPPSTSITNSNNIDSASGASPAITKVGIYSDLSQYEETLSRLIQSIDTYKPDKKIAQELIDIDSKLFNSLDSFVQYDRISSRLKDFEKQEKESTLKTKEILETLNECHNALNLLPTVDQVHFEMNTMLEQRKKINSSVLLDYATKLSKFTKIPPTFDKGSIGPNNFVWPAEDALRRGMLALAASHTDELTKIAGVEMSLSDDNSIALDEIKSVDAGEGPIPEKKDSSSRRGSYIFAGQSGKNAEHKNNEENKEEADNAVDLDLDLFNPDDF
ncbi:hypothetical protein KAFR_0G02500 [Kazachstania africana CBS 2517]|uniref:Mediator of RNA polymerase II transcription subunit 4 n=1 Tax=Kazachstania africana (strain ATCC 22294 / BCRC 22015 / CBS 2517 / CECT 1963 / NBRC 1671 / NRRL Y-8276) TaxID=1071382 RepID=H2AY33_KAZAF|nr:hypothetical protein KAFR_0G02500 [Kazachstania africana CBS 2517]CCF59283.1 hypothetical protein KAFR_0G02500 [Kazachstania africana CBS 2517]